MVGNEKLEYKLAVTDYYSHINLKYDWFYLRIALLAYSHYWQGGIGTNHLLNYMEYHSPVNAIGAF